LVGVIFFKINGCWGGDFTENRNGVKKRQEARGKRHEARGKRHEARGMRQEPRGKRKIGS